jgi:hypothetical protein
VILLLGVDDLKLEIILGELVFFLDVLNGDEFFGLSIFELFSGLGVFEVGVVVVDEGLEIAGALGELVHFLMAAGLIMQNVYNQVPLDGLAVVSSVLQYAFGLTQVNEPLARTIDLNALFGVVVQLNNSLDELAWMKRDVLVLVI